jgi:hypothetical protein
MGLRKNCKGLDGGNGTQGIETGGFEGGGAEIRQREREERVECDSSVYDERWVASRPPREGVVVLCSR